MSETVFGGPEFEIKSDRGLIVLGNSERLAVGKLWRRQLLEREVHKRVDMITLNRSASEKGRVALQEVMNESTVYTHSAGNLHVKEALQIVAFNPPEPSTFMQLGRGAVMMNFDPIIKDPDAHKTGFVDMVLAGHEWILKNPANAVRTPRLIMDGFSTVDYLVQNPEAFPEGRAIVHVGNDVFGFNERADMAAAAEAGISTAWIEDEFHTSLIFNPNGVMDKVAPHILPKAA